MTSIPWFWHSREVAYRWLRRWPAPAVPLEVIVVRKLGLPFQPELGFGAIGEGGIRVLDTDLAARPV